MAQYQQDFFDDIGTLSARLPDIDRQAGLAQLEQFAPFAGARYTNGRNFDRGRNIMALSRACLPI